MTIKRDIRVRTVLLTITVIALFGGAVSLLYDNSAELSQSATADTAGQWDPNRHSRDMRRDEIRNRFAQATVMLHAKQYDYAISALHRVLELAPRLPEAHVNMGFALLGKEAYKAAIDFFRSAIALRPEQANAYYGLAMGLEAECDPKGALGAMRTFIHLSKPDNKHVRKARSALWEWEASQSPVAENCSGLNQASIATEDQ